PSGAQAPTIIKADSSASAIIQLAVTSETMSRDELTKLVEETITERLAAVQGVADVQVNGTRNRVFAVDADQVKRASLGLTVADVRNALSTIAFDSPAGSLNAPNQNIAVRAVADVTTPDQFENIIIRDRIRIGDVATVVFAPTASNSGLRTDGRSGIGLGIVPQAQSNAVAISESVRKVVADLNQILPAGVGLDRKSVV